MMYSHQLAFLICSTVALFFRSRKAAVTSGSSASTDMDNLLWIYPDDQF